MTSWRVVSSISSIRAASFAEKVPPFFSHSAMAAAGTSPASAIARPAASSTSSHFW